jgi:hypothetical protein
LATLKASAENGAVESTGRERISSSLFSAWPSTFGTSSGDGSEHRLHAAVLERGAAQHGVRLRGDGELPDAGLELLEGELLAAQVLLHELVVGLGDGLHQLVAVLLGPLLQVGGDLLDLVLGAEGDVALGVARPDEGLHGEQVDHAGELGLGADRQLHDQRLRAEAVDDGVDGEVEVGAQLVHLVDEADAGDVVLVGLAPDRLRLGLDALLAVEDRHGAVEHAQGALDLDREVHVARGVDDVDLVVVPVAGRRGGRDRDAALLLLRHPVHGGGTIVGLADLVGDTGVEQDAFGGGGLPGIDVRHDADVADLLEVGKHVKCHGGSLSEMVPAACRPGWGRQAWKILPAVVGEGLVGLRHLVGVLPALHGGTETVGRVQDLVLQTLGHGVLTADLRVADEPAQGQRLGAARLDLDGHLVGGAADAAGLHLEGRLDVLQGLLEGGDGVGTGLGADTLEGTVDDALGGGLLAVLEDLVDQLRDDRGAVDRVDDERALGSGTLTRHYFFSFLAP